MVITSYLDMNDAGLNLSAEFPLLIEQLISRLSKENLAYAPSIEQRPLTASRISARPVNPPRQLPEWTVRHFQAISSAMIFLAALLLLLDMVWPRLGRLPFLKASR